MEKPTKPQVQDTPRSVRFKKMHVDKQGRGGLMITFLESQESRKKELSAQSSE